MFSTNDRAYVIIEHMIDDAREAIDFTKQAESFETFAQNPLYYKAIVMSLINLGELTKHLPDDFKQAHKEIPWRKITGIRDIVVHGYHTVDKKIAWDTAINSVPELLVFLEKYITEKNKLRSNPIGI
ncbi:DUF86 domain-containing protein [Campylobacterota bacterium]|nr:DUF86 domain-containing protein [Campylobacterota bacterium]